MAKKQQARKKATARPSSGRSASVLVALGAGLVALLVAAFHPTTSPLLPPAVRSHVHTAHTLVHRHATRLGFVPPPWLAPPVSQADRDAADEALGALWAHSSASRAAARARGEGPYSINFRDKANEQPDDGRIKVDDLPEADPEAKEGVDESVWEALKGQVSGDDLASMLDSLRQIHPDA